MGKKRTLTDESKWGYILIAPTIIGLIVLNVYPFIQTLILSFSATHPFGIYEITGPQNYVRMFESREFWKATWNSIYFCILTVPAGLFLSLITAVLLNAKLKGKTAFRAIYFLPMVVAPAAIAMVWKWIFNAEYGIINQMIGTKVNWLTNPSLVLLPARWWPSGAPSDTTRFCYYPASRIFPKATTRPPAWTAPPRFSSSSGSRCPW